VCKGLFVFCSQTAEFISLAQKEVQEVAGQKTLQKFANIQNSAGLIKQLQAYRCPSEFVYPLPGKQILIWGEPLRSSKQVPNYFNLFTRGKVE